MAQIDNILEELKELGGVLTHHPWTGYEVPESYFDGLAENVMGRIKALQVSDPSEELVYLSPVLYDISRIMPQSVPEGYFEELGEDMLRLVKEFQSPARELEQLSPYLGNLKKEMPFRVPEGYFEKLPIKGEARVIEIDSTKKIPVIRRKWFRYASAAVVTGLIAIVVLLMTNQPGDPEKTLAKFEKKLEKEIKKSSDTELMDFIKYTDAGQDLAVNQPRDGIKEFLKDVPASELQQFLDEIADPVFNNGENPLMD